MKETWPVSLYPSSVVSFLEVCSTELKRSVSPYTELIYLNLNFRLKFMVSYYKLIYCSCGSAFPAVFISLCRELDLGAKLARHWCSRERNELVFSQFSLLNSQTTQWDPGSVEGRRSSTHLGMTGAVKLLSWAGWSCSEAPGSHCPLTAVQAGLLLLTAGLSPLFCFPSSGAVQAGLWKW